MPEITGYRVLNSAEIALVNRVKAKGQELADLIAELKTAGGFRGGDSVTIDQRWLAIGQTHLQEGLMALTRAVTRPEAF